MSTSSPWEHLRSVHVHPEQLDGALLFNRQHVEPVDQPSVMAPPAGPARSFQGLQGAEQPRGVDA
ncbi:MAG: hypothetical protein MUF54_08345 [Polyangiaceae bacterium]|nr:hypothetical protein [Polyangiaceae bacterium]